MLIQRRRVLLLTLFLVGVSSYIDKNVISVVLEPIKAEFRLSDTMLGLLSGFSFALLYATLGIPAARWADRGDRRAIVTAALGIWSAMTIACGFAQSFWQLALARIGVGAGEAGALPPAQSLLADYFAPADRARAIGVFMLSSSVGYAIGLAAGGWIAERAGWRSAFFMMGFFGAILTPVSYALLEEPRQAERFTPSMDAQEPVLAALRALLKKAAFRKVLGATVILWFMSYGALVFTVSFIVRVHGLTVSRAGAIFGAIAALGAAIGNLGGGALADYLAKRDVAWIARLGAWGLLLGMPCYEAALLATSVRVMAALLLLSMIFMSSAVPALFAALHWVCGSKRRALAVALALFCANLVGMGLGPVIAGALSDRFGAAYGAGDGLRDALMVVLTFLLPGAWLMFRAAPDMQRDAEA